MQTAVGSHIPHASGRILAERFLFTRKISTECTTFLVNKKPLPQKWFIEQGYKDSNLEMTESESVALPFGDSPMFFCCASQQNVLYSILFKNASTFLKFFQKILQDSFRELLARIFLAGRRW